MTFREQEAARTKKSIETESYEKDGVLFWNSNNAIIPPCVFKDAGLVASAKQEAAYKADLDNFFVDYRKAQANRSPEAIAEQRAEMRAAFGPGTTVVNVITGERTKV